MGAHFGHAGDGVVGYGDMNGPYLRDIALWNNALTLQDGAIGVPAPPPPGVITAITQLGADIDGEAANDYSGWSVAMNLDGTIMAVGATQTTARAMGRAMCACTSGRALVDTAGRRH